MMNIIKKWKNKEKLNDFRFTKEQAIWFLFNQLKTHQVDFLENDLLKKIDNEMSFPQLSDILKEFNLHIIHHKSEENQNYIFFNNDNNQLEVGVYYFNQLGQIEIYQLNEKKIIEEKKIIAYFHVEKIIKFLDNEDNSQEKSFSFNWFFSEMSNYRSLWKNVLVWSLFIQLVSFALPLMTQTIVDKVITNQAQSTLISLIIGVFIFNIFNVGLNWSRQNMILFIGNKIDNTLALKVMSRLFHLPIQYFQKRATGTIISRIHAVESIREFISGSFITLVLDIPFVFVFLIIMFYYSVILSAITLFFVFLMMLLSIIVAPRIREKALEQAKISGHNQAFMTEYVSSIEAVKALQIEPHLIKEYQKTFGAYLNKTKETRTLAINYNSLMTWLEQTLNLLILGIGAYLAMNGNTFTIGMLIAFQMFASRVTQPLLRISNVWQEFQQTQISMMRLKDIMDEKEENFSLLKNNHYSGAGKIEFNHLAFKYEEEMPYLYENLNINIPAKSMLVIKGPSGCGKSTLTKLLQGLYTNYKGVIKIDGVDIKQMGMVALRNHFGVVPQETTLFAGTILDNFKLVNELITLEDVVKLCKSVGIHEAISKLPLAYNTPLGENGSGLSGGQKQRIAIARALSKKPKVLIFDESISSLDDESKNMVCETIKELNGLITILFITHIPLGNVGNYMTLDMAELKNK